MLIFRNDKYRRSIGVATSVISALKDYREPLHVDYLARIHGRSRSEIQPYLDDLEKAGLIELYEEKNGTYVRRLSK